MAGEHEDFDVEEWNRRLDATPTEPLDRPRLRARHLERYDDRHPAHFDAGDGTATPTDGSADADPFADDPFADPMEGAEVIAEEGFPDFEHNQWTIEGEIERFGAFGRGMGRAQGWKRGMAIVLLALLVLPLVLEAVQIVARLLS